MGLGVPLERHCHSLQRGRAGGRLGALGRPGAGGACGAEERRSGHLGTLRALRLLRPRVATFGPGPTRYIDVRV